MNSPMNSPEEPALSDPLVDVWESAIQDPEFATADAAFRASMLNQSGLALLNRYESAGRDDDLDLALDRFERAVEAAPDETARADTSTNLGTALQQRFERTRAISDIDRAIELHGQAVESGVEDGLPDYLGNLGNALMDRYHVTRGEQDLRRALESHERAVTLAGDRATVNHLSSFASALMNYYDETGEVATLVRAIELGQRAVASAPEATLGLRSLGSALWRRYGRSGDLADLDQATRLFVRALGRAGVNTPWVATSLSDVGLGFVSRYDETDDVVDIHLGILASKLARVWPTSELDQRPRIVMNLGIALKLRWRSSGGPSDLDAAIDATGEALAGIPAGSGERAPALLNMGSALLARHERDRSAEDLDRAIDALRKAVAASDERASDLASRLQALGRALRTRHELHEDEGDRDDAVVAYRRATMHGLDSAVEIASSAALEWEQWAAAREAWPEAAEAAAQGVEAVHRALRVQLLRTHKEMRLRQIRGVSSRAAYALAKAGDLRGAVLALEEGRALLLSEALERDRAELDELDAAGHDDLVERYRRAAEQQRSLQHQELAFAERLPPGALAPLRSDRLTEFERAHTELEAATAAIRQLPGHERFLEPASFEDVEAAAEGPLTYVTASPYGGLALFVEGGAVEVRWLPELSQDALQSTLNQFMGAYLRRHGDPSAWPRELDRVTRWLWDAAMGRLVAELTGSGTVPLVAVGPLGLLPLHAAWCEAENTRDRRRYALDDLALRFVPNARALTAARKLAAATDITALLAVEEPQPVTAERLEAAAPEVRAARAHFGRSLHLPGGQATRAAVLGALDRHQVLHFACHGFADVHDPLASAVLLAHDEPLALRDLLTGPSTSARLAVLSACETAVPGSDLPDEVVSLPTGLLQAGVAGVVGSLWSVSDMSAMAVTARFYELWRGEKSDPAEALRDAQQWVRDASNAELRDHFPAVDELNGRQVPPSATGLWERAHAYGAVQQWAAFTYVGA